MAVAVIHRTRAVLLVFGSSFLSGLAIVGFPGSSRTLVDTLGLSDEAYGRIFLPQLALAVVGGLVGGRVSERVGPKATLGLVLLCQTLSMTALLGASWVPHGYPLLLVATGSFGFSFGIAGGPWSVYPSRLFPSAKSVAVASVYTLFGVGLTVGPLFIRLCTAHGRWSLFPIVVGASAFAASALLVSTRMPAIVAVTEDGAVARRPLDRPVLALFLIASFFYATIEAGIANWAVAFLTSDQGLSMADASVALAAFFGAFTAGRLLVSLLLRTIAPTRIWTLLPVAMGLVLLALPLARAAESAWLIYGLAGLACSGHFPLSMALSSSFFEERVAQVSSWMFSALMIGIGIGAYLVGALSAHTETASVYRGLVVSPVVLVLVAVLLRRRMTSDGKPLALQTPVVERSFHV